MFKLKDFKIGIIQEPSKIVGGRSEQKSASYTTGGDTGPCNDGWAWDDDCANELHDSGSALSF